MEQPKRGEIFLVRMRGRRGTEFTGHRRKMMRPHLIVSRDSINRARPRLTIAPITSYTEYRDGKRPLWGISIQFADDMDGNNNIIVESDVYIDPNNNRYEDENGESEGLEVAYPDGKPYRAIIDCGELWTVNSFNNLDAWPGL